MALVVALAVPRIASAESTGIVLVGLLPLNDQGSGELPRLSEAQELRQAARAALQTATSRRISSHEELSAILGASYMVSWFGCAGDVNCGAQLVAPLRRVGFETGIMGDYTRGEGVYRFRLVAFAISSAKVLSEIRFELSEADARTPDRWREHLLPILASARLRIRSNVVGGSCTLDGKPCGFEGNQQVLTVTPGEHVIEIAKPQYETARVVVRVEEGADEEVSVMLQPTRVTPARTGQKGTVPGARPVLNAVRTKTPPRLDGKLDDPAWQKAWVESHFTQKFPNEAQAPTQETTLRILYDDEGIYVAVRCDDKEASKIVAQLTRRDRDVIADRVAIDISSKNDRSTAYHFQVNAAGVQLDGLRFGDTEYNNDWDGRWYSATSVDADGWTVEMMIPLVILRYPGNVGSFGLQVRRYLGRNGEINEWAYIPSDASGEVSLYGTLAEITGLRAARLFDVLLYDTRRLVVRNGQGSLDGNYQNGNLGADLKIGVTSALTLDATVNPDFGTVEADQVILNLSTVEQFFPEKRPFFIEGAELFATPLKLFYSRRIGLAPPSPGIGSLAEPLPNGKIYTAMKLTGVLAGRLSIAVLDALTARQDAAIEREDGTRDRVLVDPASNFGVLRLRQDFGTNSFVGLMGTAVNRIEPANAAAPGMDDVCPVPFSTDFVSLVAPRPRNGRCSNDAYSAGVDTQLWSDGREWGVSAQLAGSRIENGPTRLFPDGTSIGDGATGLGTQLEAGRYGGENWLFRTALKSVSPRFQTNDIGYQDQTNFHEALASLTWRTTRPAGPFQNIAVETQLKHRRSWRGNRFISVDPQLAVTLQLKNLWTMQMYALPYFPTFFENRETLDGAFTERPGGFYYSLDIKSSPNSAVVVAGNAIVYQYLGGLTALRGMLSLSARPTPTLELDISAGTSWDFDGPRWIETVDIAPGQRTYYFADLDARSVDLTLRASYTFSRRLSVQTYLQPFLASGRYTNPTEITASGREPRLSLDGFNTTSAPLEMPDFRAGSININVFLRYEYLPMSAFWLVYTRDQQQASFDPTSEGRARLRLDRFSNGPTTDVLLAKLTYLWH